MMPMQAIYILKKTAKPTGKEHRRVMTTAATVGRRWMNVPWSAAVIIVLIIIIIVFIINISIILPFLLIQRGGLRSKCECAW